jgi:hypothetical protein
MNYHNRTGDWLIDCRTIAMRSENMTISRDVLASHFSRREFHRPSKRIASSRIHFYRLIATPNAIVRGMRVT